MLRQYFGCLGMNWRVADDADFVADLAHEFEEQPRARGPILAGFQLKYGDHLKTRSRLAQLAHQSKGLVDRLKAIEVVDHPHDLPKVYGNPFPVSIDCARHDATGRSSSPATPDSLMREARTGIPIYATIFKMQSSPYTCRRKEDADPFHWTVGSRGAL